VNLAADAVAAAKMADIKAHLAQTYFAWSGPTLPGNSVYFRITGPDVQIEFAHQGSGGGPGGGPPGGPGAGPDGTGPNDAGPPGAGPTDAATSGSNERVSVQAGGVNHIHTVYRDNDYGRGFTQ
jgi:hypothetical protein